MNMILNLLYKVCRSDIELRIDRFTMEGSGWAVIGVLNHDLHVNVV